MSETLPSEIACATVFEQHPSDDLLLIDCREQNEWDFVKIEGAVLIPMSEIQDRLDEVKTLANGKSSVVVHCHHGGRSLRVSNFLRGQGIEKSQSMAGGIDEWADKHDSSLPRY